MYGNSFRRFFARQSFGRLTKRLGLAVLPFAAGGVLYSLNQRYGEASKHIPLVVSAEEKKPNTLNNGGVRFMDKTVLITGAAGDVGSTTAREFAREKAQLVLCDLPSREEELQALARELLSLGSPAVIHVAADVSNVEQVKELVQRSIKQLGGIDILFNHAGMGHAPRPIQSIEDDVFRRVQEVNLFGVFLMMKYVAQHMIESGRGGVIVNMTSASGLIGTPLVIPYCASKFAVVGMTRTAAKELAPHHIRVCAVAPGFLEGSFARDMAKSLVILNGGKGTPEEVEGFVSVIMQQNPMGREGRLIEVARLVLFLSSDEASYINGAVIPVEGGLLA